MNVILEVKSPHKKKCHINIKTLLKFSTFIKFLDPSERRQFELYFSLLSGFEQPGRRPFLRQSN